MNRTSFMQSLLGIPAFLLGKSDSKAEEAKKEKWWKVIKEYRVPKRYFLHKDNQKPEDGLYVSGSVRVREYEWPIDRPVFLKKDVCSQATITGKKWTSKITEGDQVWVPTFDPNECPDLEIEDHINNIIDCDSDTKYVFIFRINGKNKIGIVGLRHEFSPVENFHN